MDRELVNGHPVEVTFQGGYYVAQSLTKQWQDPRLVGKGPLLSQGQPKSKKLEPAGQDIPGVFLSVTSQQWGRQSRLRPPCPHGDGGGLARK